MTVVKQLEAKFPELRQGVLIFGTVFEIQGKVFAWKERTGWGKDALPDKKSAEAIQVPARRSGKGSEHSYSTVRDVVG